MRRIVLWALGLAVVGAALANKRAEFEVRPVLVGLLGGAFLGSCLGYLFHKSKSQTEQRRKDT